MSRTSIVLALLGLICFTAYVDARACQCRPADPKAAACCRDKNGANVLFNRDIKAKVDGCIQFGPCGRPKSTVNADIEDKGKSKVCGNAFQMLETAGKMAEILKLVGNRFKPEVKCPKTRPIDYTNMDGANGDNNGNDAGIGFGPGGSMNGNCPNSGKRGHGGMKPMRKKHCGGSGGSGSGGSSSGTCYTCGGSGGRCRCTGGGNNNNMESSEESSYYPPTRPCNNNNNNYGSSSEEMSEESAEVAPCRRRHQGGSSSGHHGGGSGGHGGNYCSSCNMPSGSCTCNNNMGGDYDYSGEYSNESNGGGANSGGCGTIGGGGGNDSGDEEIYDDDDDAGNESSEEYGGGHHGGHYTTPCASRRPIPYDSLYDTNSPSMAYDNLGQLAMPTMPCPNGGGILTGTADSCGCMNSGVYNGLGGHSPHCNMRKHKRRGRKGNKGRKPCNGKKYY